jgi:hypothetical protein
MARRLDDIRLAVLMLDGIDLKGRCNVVALGITTEGVKIPLGLWEGSTENAAVATALLADLVDRGLDVGRSVLCVLDGAKVLRKAVRDVLGTDTPVQRCIRHKECHEGQMTSAAAATLERVVVAERRQDAAVCGTRLGDQAGTMARGDDLLIIWVGAMSSELAARATNATLRSLSLSEQTWRRVANR